MEYDVIGDVHGHAAALESLLEELGYEHRAGAYRHSNPDRTAIFVGDLIDRGPEQIKAVDIPRRMRDAGTAAIVMGNHEHNAIGFATPDPSRPGHSLRIRGTKNREQHRVFLDQVGEDSSLHLELVEWMATLPMFLELDGIRVVHACWHPEQIEILARSADANGVLGLSALRSSFEKGTELRNAAEIVLKGLEIDLPEGMSFNDAQGHRRDKSRLRWWDETAGTFAAAAVMEEGMDNLPDIALPAASRVSDPSMKPVFFGHYWMKGTPQVLSPRKTCVDFSIAKDGVLCAYTWRGESELDPGNLTWTSRPPAAAMTA